MRRGIIALLGAAVVLTLGAALASAAPAKHAVVTNFAVDDISDGVQCPTAGYDTIQAAVDDSTAGGKIKVCPGVYDESVVVNNVGHSRINLTIQASAPHPDFQSCNDTETTPNRAYVTGDDFNPDHVDDGGSKGGPAFTIASNGVKLLNFTVQDVVDWPGIKVNAGTGGFLAQANLIQHNTFGMYLNSSGTAASTVTQNCFRFNNEPGSASGNGIYEDQGIRNTTVSANKFWFNGNSGDGAAMNFTVTPGGPPWTPVSGVIVKGNISTGDVDGVDLYRATTSQVQSNIINKPENRGVFLGPGNVGTIVKGNIITDSQSDGIRVRNNTTDDGWTGNNSASKTVTIASNIIQRSTIAGIRIDFNGGPTTSLTNSTISANIVQQSGHDGIYIGFSNTNNQILRNIFQNSNGGSTSGPYQDCHDQSKGASPPNTGTPKNTWTGNIGGTENWGNLCFGAVITPTLSHPPE